MSDVEKTLSERGARYGDFTDHAVICQSIKRVMMNTPGWERLNDVQRQALDVIADKQARILSGDPDYADNWHDIQGYAKLVEDRLPVQSAVQKPEPEPADPMKDFATKFLGDFMARDSKAECNCPACTIQRTLLNAEPGDVIAIPLPKGTSPEEMRKFLESLGFTPVNDKSDDTPLH